MNTYDTWKTTNPYDKSDPEEKPSQWEEMITELDKLENSQGKMDEKARLDRIDSLYLALETL